jgi:hypothetical protein
MLFGQKAGHMNAAAGCSLNIVQSDKCSNPMDEHVTSLSALGVADSTVLCYLGTGSLITLFGCQAVGLTQRK